jgi:hypothetical protein
MSLLVACHHLLWFQRMSSWTSKASLFSTTFQSPDYRSPHAAILLSDVYWFSPWSLLPKSKHSLQLFETF